uniref:Uncharacterized protein n=1 Tax=Setaria viridis TaxID=4556 RepID=A0A4U6UL57_SETVI|nr:hypothetical protein SEVIR_5G335650v2 [Setaria viridis]
MTRRGPSSRWMMPRNGASGRRCRAASLTPAQLCPRCWGSWTASSSLVVRLSKNAVGGNPISFGWSGGSGSASTWTDSGPGSCPCKLPPPSRSSMICRGASRRRRRMRGGWRPSSRSSPRGPAATTRSSRPLPKRPATTPRSSHG